MSSIPFFLLVFLFAASAWAQDLPTIPDSDRILTQDEVKNFWINSLPVAQEPSRLARNYKGLIEAYHEQIRSRQSFIAMIQSGEYDLQARIAMLRHNVATYRLKGAEEKAAALEERLEDLEIVAQQQEKERANVERQERLIAATERLAAAIEKNGGIASTNVVEVIESDASGYEAYIAHLNHEMARIRNCPTPPVVQTPSNPWQRVPHTEQPRTSPAQPVAPTPQPTVPQTRPRAH
jgi:hypothetical protein